MLLFYLYMTALEKIGMISIKHGTILHGVDSARPIAHEPIVDENNRSYRLDTPPIQHRLDCARISYAKTIGRQLNRARIGYAKTIRHRLDCARNGYTRTIQQQPDCAPVNIKKNCLIKSNFFLTSQCIYNARKLDVYS